MIETIIGGAIALSSGIVVGILTPTINTKIQNRRIINQQILKLTSILYLLKNTLSSYLNQHIYINNLGEVEAGEDECLRLKTISNQMNSTLDILYEVQQELILNFKSDVDSVSLVYERLNQLDCYVWTQKMHFNDKKYIYDQVSSDDYSNSLNKMLDESMVPKLNSLILLNQTILKQKSIPFADL